VAPVLRTLSDPARSTRFRDATRTAPSVSTPSLALSLLSTTSLIMDDGEDKFLLVIIWLTES
jgi:hypothetical protein